MKLKGIFAPIVTPFDQDDNINFPVLEQLIEFLLENKVAGLIPGGTTGEVYALNDAERLEIFKFVKEKAKGRLLLPTMPKIFIRYSYFLFDGFLCQ